MKYMFMSGNKNMKYEIPYFNYPNSNPLISIHVPTYNKKYLNIGYDFTINIVVLAYLQTFENWELRLIDNHDGDLDLIYLFDEVEKILNKKVDRTKVLYHKAKKDFIGDKRNELINYTIAPIICNWDDDDLYLPEYLSTIYQLYENNPFGIGIFTGKRWQYNLCQQQRLLWYNATCNGAGYYVFRTDAVKQFQNIRYGSMNHSEEVQFLHELNKTIKYVEEYECMRLSSNIDEQYIRIRFGGNITDENGWKNDIEIKKRSGGLLIDDPCFQWLFVKIPLPLHNIYRSLINKLH